MFIHNRSVTIVLLMFFPVQSVLNLIPVHQYAIKHMSKTLQIIHYRCNVFNGFYLSWWSRKILKDKKGGDIFAIQRWHRGWQSWHTTKQRQVCRDYAYNTLQTQNKPPPGYKFVGVKNNLSLVEVVEGCNKAHITRQPRCKNPKIQWSGKIISLRQH